MAIVVPSTRGQWWNTVDPCFTCLQPIPADQTLVLWDGVHRIGLHWECAQKLGAALIGDALQAQILSWSDVGSVPGVNLMLNLDANSQSINVEVVFTEDLTGRVQSGTLEFR